MKDCTYLVCKQVSEYVQIVIKMLLFLHAMLLAGDSFKYIQNFNR